MIILDEETTTETTGHDVPVLYEADRATGRRKAGSIYLAGQLRSSVCCMLPALLRDCPTCGHGVKQSRGYQTVDAGAVLRRAGTPSCTGDVVPGVACPVYRIRIGATTDGEEQREAGLVWIGTEHYDAPADFIAEATEHGVALKVRGWPRGFQLGDQILLAHPHAVPVHISTEPNLAGVFAVFEPEAVQQVVSEEQAADRDLVDGLRSRNVTPVVVRDVADLPDEEPDHEAAEATASEVVDGAEEDAAAVAEPD